MPERQVSIFTHFAKKTSKIAGRPYSFIVAMAMVLIWVVSGPFFDYSNTWQLVINTGTTIVTFLMVFLIQSSQNCDTEAIQIKLDELIRANRRAQNELLDLEDLDEEVLDRFKAQYEVLAAKARQKKGEADT